VTADTTIRPMRMSDIEELVALVRDHALYERAAPLRSDLEAALVETLFGPEPRMHVLVAVDRGALVGYASWAMEVSTWGAAEYLHLDCLYVQKQARGRGIGHDLIRAIRKGAREAGVVEMQWQTPEWNDGAIRFYQRFGARSAAKMRFTLAIAQGTDSELDVDRVQDLLR